MESVVYNQEGKQVGKVELPDGLFGVKWNADTVHQFLTSEMSDRRHPVAHTKNRGEVRGGGKKPWRQKGTGRARHGSRRSPIWVGGGVTHGPRNDKNFSRKVNKKMANKTLAMVLTRKANEGEVVFLDKIVLPEAKTRHAVSVLNSLAKIKGLEIFSRKRNNVGIFAMPGNDLILKRVFNNVGKIALSETRNINAVDLLSKKFLILVNPEESLKILKERLA